MANFNQVTLVGTMTRDPQLRYLPNQTVVADFGLAVNRRWRGPQGEAREEVTFVDCTAWAKQAETINQYCGKGKQLLVSGRLKQDVWDDRQTGAKRSKLSVVVENFQFIGSKSDGEGGGRPPARPSAAAQVRSRAAEDPGATIGDERHFKEDDIPFELAHQQ